jgi:serine/threonine protein kinase
MDFIIPKEGTDGIFGTVFKVFDKKTEQFFAMKVPSPKSNANVVQNEINIMKQLKHKNIVRLHDVCTKDGQTCILMETANGDFFDFITQSHDLCPLSDIELRYYFL